MHKSLIIRIWAILLLLVMCTSIAACHKTDNPNSYSPDQPTLGTSIDTGAFDKDDLLAIMNEAEKLLAGGKYTIENPSSYVQYFLRTNKQTLSDCVETKENSTVLFCSGAKSNQRIVMKYGIFLHLICSRYPDAICDADYTYTQDTNRPYYGYLFFFPDYKEAGYKTPLEACKALDMTSGKIEDNAFYINMEKGYKILEGHMRYGTVIYNLGNIG